MGKQLRNKVVGLHGCRFKDNNTVLSEYHYNVRGKSRVSDQTCDDLCKRETLCYVTNIVSSDFLECLV